MADIYLSRSRGYNNWSTTLPKQVLYGEGSSFIRGEGLGTAQLANGGLTGNFWDVFSKSIWGAGKGSVSYNDGVTGSTTAQALARYTTGNSTYGVTVPAAHDLAPATTGSSARAIFAIDMATVYNDANGGGIDAATSISNLNSLTTIASGEGYFVVLLTCNVPGTTSAIATQIATVNQAARDGRIFCDLLADAATWIPNQQDTYLYQNDHLHPTLVGHKAVGSNLLAGMISGGFPVNYAGPYYANMTVVATAENTPAIALSGALTGGRGLLELTNTTATNYVQARFIGTGKTWAFGLGNAGETGVGVANAMYLYNATDGVLAFKAEPSGNLTVAGSAKTGAPSGGTAGAWKLGIKVDATVALDTTKYLQVDVGGTAYKIGLVS